MRVKASRAWKVGRKEEWKDETLLDGPHSGFAIIPLFQFSTLPCLSPPPPQPIVELLLGGHTHAVHADDAVTPPEAGGARGPGLVRKIYLIRNRPHEIAGKKALKEFTQELWQLA